MKKVFIIIKVFFTFIIHAQTNLVMNPSFESYTVCPTALYQLDLTLGWWPAMYTPDYYNACDPTKYVGVPKNWMGNQIASSGSAYGGFFAFTPEVPQTYREYLRGQLTQPLQARTKYYLSMKVNCPERWGYDDTGYAVSESLACNMLGMKFITFPIIAGNPPTLQNFANLMNNQAHLYSQKIITDTTNWTTIQGSFIADSAYTHVMIGNFFDNNHTDTLKRKYSANTSYYYVDDVIVSTDSTIIDYTLGMAESSYTNKLMLYPNPAKDKLTLVFDNKQNTQNNKALFYNLLGELIYQKPITETNTEIDIGFLKRGLYYVKVQNAVAKVLVE